MLVSFSGLIGRSWAMVFLSGGYRVKLYDNQPGQASKAITEIRFMDLITHDQTPVRLLLSIGKNSGGWL